MKTFLLNAAIVTVLFAGVSTAKTSRWKSLRALVSEEGKQANLDLDGSIPLSAEEGGEGTAAINFGDLNTGLGGNWGNDGWKPDGWKPDGWQPDGHLGLGLGDVNVDIHKTMTKMEHNGFDVEKACEEIYPTTSTGPTCDCKAETPATLSQTLTYTDTSQTSVRKEWGSAGDPDFCNATDWSYDFCLQTGVDVEATRGTVTLKPPSACANTQDEIKCEIEKFRMTPPFPTPNFVNPDTSVYFVAAGLAQYQGANHSCSVLYGKMDANFLIPWDLYEPLPFFSFSLQPSYTDLTNDWIYETNSFLTLNPAYRDFIAYNETDMAANPPLDLAQCGVYEPIAPTNGGGGGGK